MATTTMHFGPEWMRPKQQSISRPQQPPSPPNPPAAMSTYSALVSPAPPNQAEAHDEAHPFRYTKEDLLRIFKDTAKAGLGLEVERWEGVVREHGSDPIGLREFGEAEKKLFSGPLNSDVRRRQSTDYLSPLSTANLSPGGPRLNHNSPAVGSPMRERFGNIKRRDSNADSPASVLPRKQSLSGMQPPAMSPREVGNPPPRARVGYTPAFDGVLSGGESRVARRRASEGPQKSGGSGGEDDFNERTDGIKEEKEEENVNNLASLPGGQDGNSSTINDACGSKDVNSLAGDVGQLSLNTNIASPLDSTQSHSSISAPGLVDLGSVEWSYKDPTGTIQGPFSAELMQKWFDDGYFTPDLPMKRTHLDATWSTLEQLRRRCPSDRIFLTPLHPAPPGLSMRNDSPSQYNGSDQTINGPYQPAPIRSLRTSTLESYISTGSNYSESPSSSFGTGRFGDSSPEPNTFGGRVIGGQFYNGDPSGSARGSFQTTPEIPSAFSGRRGLHAESPVDGSMGMRSSTFGTYGYANSFGSAQSPWGTPTNNFGSPYEVISPAHDIHDHSGLQNYTNQGLGVNFNSLRTPHDSIPDTTMSYTVGVDHGARPLGDPNQYPGLNMTLGTGDQLYSHATHQFNTQQQQPAPTDPVHQQGALSIVTSQQSPWSDAAEANVQLDGPFNNNQPVIGNIVAQPLATPSHTSVWDQQIHAQPSPSIPTPKEASAWDLHSHVPVDSAWGEPPEEPSVNDEPQAEADAHQSPVDHAPTIIAPEAQEELKAESEVAEVTSAPVPPVPTPPTSGKSRKQKESKAPAVQAPSTPQSEAPSLQVSAQKLAWQKEDDAKKAVSLREIQEAESKKAEARKVAERERDRAVRAAAAISPEKEDIQAFTASWGLPTSQAGSRGGQVSVKEVTPVSTPSVTGPVWTNTPKITPAKKTMKEILEEEEKRKKTAPQVTAALAAAASTPRRPYAESSTKTPTVITGGAWTTVGPNGKSNPVVTATSPSRPGATSVSATSHTNGSAAARPSQHPASKTASAPAARIEDTTPSHEFLNWLNNALKGLNNSVSVEEIMHMLLSFPIEADASIREIISETIYTNSTTMDGRRFADEFVSRRKADAISHAKNPGASKASTKPISIADVVKAAPKTTQPEWGFKVVNKKKKGGRS